MFDTPTRFGSADKYLRRDSGRVKDRKRTVLAFSITDFDVVGFFAADRSASGCMATEEEYNPPIRVTAEPIKRRRWSLSPDVHALARVKTPVVGLS